MDLVRLSKQKLVDEYVGNFINLSLIIWKKLFNKKINTNPQKIIIYK